MKENIQSTMIHEGPLDPLLPNKQHTMTSSTRITSLTTIGSLWQLIALRQHKPRSINRLLNLTTPLAEQRKILLKPLSRCLSLLTTQQTRRYHETRDLCLCAASLPVL